VASDPTEEELRAFIESMLSNLDKQLREPDVIDAALREHREMWETLYRAGSGLDARKDPA
jgi:hypothetical protein